MSELTIYPWPSSYNEFRDRNPDIIDLADQLRHIAQEISLWKATSPNIDLRIARLSHEEKLHRDAIEAARALGAEILVLDAWPKVGEYDIPEDLRLAA